VSGGIGDRRWFQVALLVTLDKFLLELQHR
jgi:hypothetical protein